MCMCRVSVCEMAMTMCPRKNISCELHWNVICNDDDCLISFSVRPTIFTVFCDFWCSTGYFLPFIPILVSSFIFFHNFFSLVRSFACSSDQTMITIRNEDKRTEFICICIWCALCFRIIILPPVNRQASVCVCICAGLSLYICGCIWTRHTIKNRRENSWMLWCPYRSARIIAMKTIKLSEWRPPLSPIHVFFNIHSVPLHSARPCSALNQPETKPNQAEPKWTNKDIWNIFIWVSVVSLSLRQRRASSTPFTCQLYLWLFIYFILLSL